MMLPRKIGPFTLTRRLGSDGATESFVAILDEPAGKQVVVRRLLPWLVRDPSRLAAAEARIQDLTGIRHPSLVSVTDYVATPALDGGSDSEERFVVEEYVDAVDLDQIIAWCRQNGRVIPHNIYLNLATQICNGLEALHGRPGKASGAENVLHLALQPASILLMADGKLQIGGYGVVRSSTALPNPNLSEAGSTARVEYLSPEQTQPDQKLSPASDIFALGTLLYELLTMEGLFRAESALQTVHRVRRAEVTTPLLRVKEVMPGLDKVLYRALSLNPRHRYQRAFVLREDLRGLMSGYSFASIADETREFLAPMFAGRGRAATGRPTLSPALDTDPETSALLESAIGSSSFADDTAALIRRAQERSGPSTLVPADGRQSLSEETTGETSDSGRPAAPRAFPSTPPMDDPVTSWERAEPQQGSNTSWHRAPGATPPPVPARPEPTAFDDDLRTEPKAASITPPAPAPRAPTPSPVPAAERAGLAASAPPPARRASAPEPELEPTASGGGNGMMIGAGIAVAAIALVGLFVCAGVFGGGAAFLAGGTKGGVPPVAPRTTLAVPGTDPTPATPDGTTLDPVPADGTTGTTAPPVAPAPVPPPVETTPPPVTHALIGGTADASEPVIPREPPRPQHAASTTTASVGSFDLSPAPRAVSPSHTASTSTSASRTATASAFDIAPPALTPPDDGAVDALVDVAGPLGDYSARAHAGALSPTDRSALEKIATDAPDYSRARVLLYEDAKARGDTKARSTYLDSVMSVPENKYNPALLAEQAEFAVERGDWRTAIDRANLAERQWQRLPPDLVFSRKAMIYECEAAGYQGLFYASGGDDLDSLHAAIRSWEKYKRHVDTKSRLDLSQKADEELAKLQDMQRRLE